MGKYLTVQQLQQYAVGVDLTALSSDVLEDIIQDAESTVDTYCATEHQPRSWIQQSRWDSTTRRFYPQTSPVPVTGFNIFQIQVSTQAITGNPFAATIPVNELVVNNFEHWVEAVSLQAIMYSLSPVLINLGLNTVIVRADYTTGWQIEKLGEVLSLSGTGVYQSKRAFWLQTLKYNPSAQPFTLPPCPPVVYVDGSVQEASAYTVDYANGVVTFVTPPSSSAIVTADYTYSIPDPVRDATRHQAMVYLAEYRSNQIGLLGVLSADLPNQVSVTRAMPVQSGIHPYAARKLARYRHISL